MFVTQKSNFKIWVNLCLYDKERNLLPDVLAFGQIIGASKMNVLSGSIFRAYNDKTLQRGRPFECFLLGISKDKTWNLKIRNEWAIFQLQFDMGKGKNRIVRKK